MTCEPWPIMWPCDDDGGRNPPDADPTVIDAATAAARDILWSLTGHRLGICAAMEAFWSPREHCGPDRFGRIALSRSPVVELVEIIVSGTPVDVDDFRVVGGMVLSRHGWPAVRAADPEITIRYRHGVPLGSLDAPTHLTMLVAVAMGEIATELIGGMCGGQCRLPSNLAGLSRQGVTLDFLPPGDFIEAGLTGLPAADALIRATNPNRLVSRSRVMSPDTSRRGGGIP